MSLLTPAPHFLQTLAHPVHPGPTTRPEFPTSKAPPYLGPHGGPSWGAISYERGTPARGYIEYEALLKNKLSPSKAVDAARSTLSIVGTSNGPGLQGHLIRGAGKIHPELSDLALQPSSFIRGCASTRVQPRLQVFHTLPRPGQLFL